MMENINQFIREIKHYNLWNSIEIKTAAFKVDSVWKALVTKVLLSSNKEMFSRKLLETENLLLLHEAVPFDRVESLLTGLGDKKFTAGGLDLKLEIQGNISFKEGDASYGEYFNIAWPGMTLVASGSGISDLEFYDEIKAELQNHDRPYEDLVIVSKELLGYKKDWNTCHLNVVAPIYAAIREIKIQEDEVIVDVECHESILEKIKLSVVAYSEKNFREKMNFSKDDIADKNNQFLLLRKSIGISSPTLVRSYLFLDNKRIDSRSETAIGKGMLRLNPRIIAHEFFDASSETLRQWLEGKGAQTDKDFEASVHWLLHICGFQSEWLGYGGRVLERVTKGLGEFDILAFVPNEESLLAVECTTSIPKIPEKISAIYNRTQELQKHLENIEIIPVLFIPFSNENVVEEIKESAKKSQIAFVAKEDIEQIFEMTVEGKDTEEILERLRGLGGLPWIPGGL